MRSDASRPCLSWETASHLASEEGRQRDEGMDEPCHLRYARAVRILENGLVEFARGRIFGLHALRHAYRRPRGSAAVACYVQSISIRPCLTLQERSRVRSDRLE